MSNEEKYFAVLSGAMAQIDSESFEARGAVYDRLWKIILGRLQNDADASDEQIANERRTFLAAVQRIEFGERLSVVDERPLPAEDEQPEPVRPEAVQPEATAEAAKPEATKPQAARAQAAKPKKRWRRPTFGRVALRMVGACALLLFVCSIYLLVRFDPASAARWIKEHPQSAWQGQVMRAVIYVHRVFEKQSVAVQGARQRAVLYEENSAIASGSTYTGYAIWRQQREGNAASAVVLSIDVEIPQKELVLKLEVRPAADTGGVISHLIEFKFLSTKGTLSEAVQDVLGVLMKTDELSPGAELAGKVVRVRPGVFLMGLSGAAADLERNLRLLRERPWLDIPIVFRGGARSLLAIEKGTTGQNAVNDLLRSGGQG